MYAYEIIVDLNNLSYKVDNLEQMLLKLLEYKQYYLNDQQIGNICLKLGSIYESQNRLKQAEEYLIFAKNSWIKAYGDDSYYMAAVYSLIGLIKGQQGDMQLSKDNITHSLKILQQYKGPDDPELAEAMHNLGHLYLQMGQLEEAVKIYNQAKQIIIEAYGNQHKSLEITHSGLASVYKLQGKLAEAETELLNAIKIQSEIYGNDHFGLASRYNNLGAIYEEQGKLKEAEENYLKALQIDTINNGENDQEVAIDLNNLAMLYEKLGNLQQAEENYLLAIKIGQQDDNNKMKLLTFNGNLGLMYQVQQKFNQALQYLQIAHNLANEVLGQAHARTKFFESKAIEVQQRLQK